MGQIDPLADSFRQAMRCFANSVCIVAARNGNVRGGATVTSVCSVSMSPPSLLVCINRNSASRNLLHGSRYFSVSILVEEDAALADVFAGRTERKDWDSKFAFAGDRWSEDENGTPLLKGALATAVCERQTWLESGSHSIVIGDIRSAFAASHWEAPLVYAYGAYTRLVNYSF
jgi:flavin reductase (DIM6/NTAB) family NADH-FMN oxidoreductase RutF